MKNKSTGRSYVGWIILLGSVAIAGWLSAAGIGLLPPFTALQKTTAEQIVSSKSDPSSNQVDIYNDSVQPVASSVAYHMLDKTIHEEIRQGRPSYALKLLGKDPLAKKIKNSEYDRLRASIAQSYLTEGKTKVAFDVARESSKRSKHEAPNAAWVGGMAAWKLKDYPQAADLFTMAADSSRSSPWLRSASAFWASRAYAKTHDFKHSDSYMAKAARYPRTFYGLIASKSLDRDLAFNWNKPRLKTRHKKSLEESKSVQAAIDLADKGQMSAALVQLGKSGWLDHGYKQQQLLSYILEKDVPGLALALGRQTKNDHGGFYDAALYPEAPWDPAQGYEVDRALVNALILQESRFDPSAQNASGAKGLMQLMPATANFMAKGDEVSLSHPEINITVGQKYVRHLLMDPSVNNDLFYMAIAYNAGPGNLSRWKRQYGAIQDPLLFIESIPSPETRGFVERVMVNYWIYRMRMGKDNPSLDAVVARDRFEYVDAGQKTASIQLASEN